MDLGDKIYELRKNNGMSQEELANQLSVTRQSISLWETNQTVPSLENLKEIANIFHISLDELCGLKEDVSEETNVEVKEEKQGFFASGKILYTKNVLERTMNISIRKNNILSFIFIPIFLFFAISILISEAHNAFVVIPLTFCFIDIITWIKQKRQIRNRVNHQLSNRPNAVLSYWFYEDHMEGEVTSDTSFSKFSKNYSEITKTLTDSSFMYLFYDGVVAPIDKDSLKLEEYEKICALLHFKEKPKSKSKGYNIASWILFVLSIISIYFAMMLMVFLSSLAPIPEYPSSPEYMWTFYVFLPIPVASLILGIIGFVKKQKGYKNIIIGCIMSFVLFMFGCFSIIPDFRVYHDFSYLEKVEEETRIHFPKNGDISWSYNNKDEIDAMVKFKNKDEILSIIYSNSDWKQNQSAIPLNTISSYSTSITSNYDYFLVYDVDCKQYNNINETHKEHKFYYFAYEEKTNILYILSGKLQ